MTRYFEVTHRDCAARIGRLMLNRRITTPAILSSELLRQNRGSIIDCGCVWDNHRSIPSDPDKLLLLPHRSLPLHAPQELIEQFDAPIRMRHDGAAGVVVHPAQIDTSIPDGLDLYLIGAARMLGMRAGLLVDCVLKLKNNIRADTAVYAPALATPENLAILIYLGIDLVDDTAAIIKGYQDVYLTRDGGKYLNRLREFPCACKICTGLETPEELQSLPRSERARLLAEHNTIKLGEELRTVRECIRDGNLREYVEKQCRSDPYLTAVLRLLDSEHAYLEERTPTARKGTMIANTAESQNRVEITRFAGRTLSRFSPPDVDILVILPCSAKKPYSLSRSHARFVDALSGCRSHIHEIVLTSPIGVVPRELETVYPAAHYDIAVTGEWSLDETAWVASCLRAYLEKHAYKKIIAHVSGGFAEVCRIVERDLGIEIVYSAIGNPTSDDSLARLRECVAASVPSQSRNRSRKPNLETVRAIADYQFGSGVGEILIPDHARVKRVKPIARMKSMRQIKQGQHGFRILVDREEIATSVRYGTLALTLAGAARMPDDIYCVTIDNFLPKGSVLAPGVTGSDPQIRPMDEVIVLGERALGVGVAMMNGREMVESSRGVAVEMRAVQER
uniref:Archaeosine synthase n=2 Tax=Candidatus Methanogaster sp. ANME-2c ERB4 TaxID=2759911 RepID=A0A7G9YB18_9EURY|nr:archaeosine synthase [Methanosarcinales archaeon ANME-2c ERB4]QNO44470.1 archaeosine synthase [Methanosarcinales archaeon ANME-2c ERB4]QNO44641.1 archaeosine synthase [Methanosarcinales archaeon ANME-2c ERB4]QNO45202.1 archaeosine synthase [Methanosarcinales archaeon ANME-2c ERB4]